MTGCHICGAAMRDEERVCPTCGSSTAADPYSPGLALVAEVNLLLTPLWYAFFFSMYAALNDRHRAAARPL